MTENRTSLTISLDSLSTAYYTIPESPTTPIPCPVRDTGPSFHSHYNRGTINNTANYYTPASSREIPLPTSTRVNDAPGAITRHFVGRTDELLEIHRALNSARDANHPVRYAVHGEAAIGKTQLLLKYANNAYAQERYSHIFYMSAASPKHLLEGLARVLQLLKPPDYVLIEANIPQEARRCLEDADSSIVWLIIIDDVASQSINFLQTHLPRENSRGDLLFASQSDGVSKALIDDTRRITLEIGPLAQNDAIKLLLRKAEVEESIESMEKARVVVFQLGCLPVPIRQAASFAKHFSGSLERLLDLLEKSCFTELSRWHTRFTGYEHSTFQSVVLRQCARLADSDPQAANLLRILSFLDPRGVQIPILAAGACEILSWPKRTSEWYRLKGINLFKKNATDTLRALLAALVLPSEHILLTTIASPIEFHNVVLCLQQFSLVHLDVITPFGIRREEKPMEDALHVLRIPPLVGEIVRKNTNQVGKNTCFDMAVCIMIATCLQFCQDRSRSSVSRVFSGHLYSLNLFDKEQGQPNNHRTNALKHAESLILMDCVSNTPLTTELPIKWLPEFLRQGSSFIVLCERYKTALLSVGKWEAGKKSDIYRRTLGVIILSQAPLTDGAVADLLGLSGDDRRTSRHVIWCLGSIIRWSEGQPAQILHKSFSVYLTDPNVCISEPWFIDVDEHQRALTIACLRVMEKSLHFNIGNLETSYQSNFDLPDLSAHADAVISPILSYSCRFWGYHLGQTVPGEFTILDLILPFFKTKFLYWLEVLSLLGEVSLAPKVLLSVIDQTATFSNDVQIFARDGLKFVRTFAPVIACSVPHIYLSCIPFAPRKSPIKQHYMCLLPNLFMFDSTMEDDWPKQTLEGHSGSVNLMALSLDATGGASGSQDRSVPAWDAKTGALVAGPFKGHTGFICSVAFSSDGSRIASGSYDKTIRVWDAKTGALVAGPFKEYNGFLCSVTFSPNGSRIASGSYDHTVQVWEAETGALVARLKGHTGTIFSVAFSSDGSRIASSSSDKTTRVWDTQTGALVVRLKGHTGVICSVAFSFDGSRIASGSNDKTIRVWDAKTGALVARLKGHTGTNCLAAFSSDGSRIASGSYDNTVRIWDTKTGALAVGPLEGHTSWIHSVTFSPNDSQIISCSEDSNVRIWNAETGALLTNLCRGNDKIRSAAFSSDGRHLVSSSVHEDGTIRILNLDNLCSLYSQNDSISSSQGARSNMHSGLGSEWELKDGWMRNPADELLFFVPHQYRGVLRRPYDTLVISRHSTTRIDYTRFVHGKDWVRCHI